MADIFASSGASSGGYTLEWSLVFDDAADTVTIDATYTGPNGPPQPQVAALTVTLNTSASIGVDFLTGLLSTGGSFVQGSPGNMLNAGAKTRTNVRLQISPDRAAGITHSTEFLPPA